MEKWKRGNCLNQVWPVYCRSFLQACRGAFMDSTSQSAKWTPHELRTASILYERRTEAQQLQQLRLRLQKKMREEADRAAASTAA